MADHTATGTDATGRRSLPQALRLVALVLGAGYLVLGAGGFFVPGNAALATPDGFEGHVAPHTLLVFSVGPVLNVIHTLGGLAGLAAARSVSGTALFGLAGSVGFASVGAFGVLALTYDTGGRPDFTWADVVLHLATAAVLVALAHLGFRVVNREAGDHPGGDV
ncbi:DUF4383 domain-containing protein [Amycolatopsis sp., V23-08]|uniref:DUF4383 domain-containing protein n=1 Tax=Amycolatopsis heterodermiae TaxID=3110235 RepID=A0ABU5R488_9PSEU|nr:DUF4383 domain-containing protein [Amycolatopsis sp., V23-08]MEA5361036.1 DUF4383 domain-containing protein [Amycolatopsis sp., V23-08]